LLELVDFLKFGELPVVARQLDVGLRVPRKSHRVGRLDDAGDLRVVGVAGQLLFQFFEARLLCLLRFLLLLLLFAFLRFALAVFFGFGLFCRLLLLQLLRLLLNVHWHVRLSSFRHDLSVDLLNVDRESEAGLSFDDLGSNKVWD